MPDVPAPVHGEGLLSVGPLPTDEDDVEDLAARLTLGVASGQTGRHDRQAVAVPLVGCGVGGMGVALNPGDGQQPQPVSLPEAFGGNRRLSLPEAFGGNRRL